ncbi:hypothetical protein CRG95_04325 [Escherichia sp. E4208]|nr:hypothetical protein CRG95_04325 [Escherichia sp. E4208]
MSLRLFSLTNRRSSRCAGSNPRISGCQVRNGKAPALHFRPQSVMAAGDFVLRAMISFADRSPKQD